MFLVIFFIVSPTSIPKVLRKIGEFFAFLKKARNQVMGFSGDNTRPTERGTGQGGSTGKEEISYMERQSYTAVKNLVLEQLLRDYDTSQTGFVLPMLFDGSEEIRLKAAKALTADPVFSFEKRLALHPRESWRTKINETPDISRPFIESLFREDRTVSFADYIASVPDFFFKPLVTTLAEFPGIDTLDLNKIFINSKRKYYDKFLTKRENYFKRLYPRQLFIVPSYYCNAGCSFCFAAALQKRYPGRMEKKEFTRILDVANSGKGIKRVGFMGGEPTLVPHLHQLIDEIEKRELYFYFPTNGMTEEKKFTEIIKRPSLESVTFHIEKDPFYSIESQKLLLKNIETVLLHGKDIILRYTLTNPESQDWSFLNKYIELLPFFRLNFAVVFPSLAASKKETPEIILKSFKTKILSLVNYVTGRCRQGSYEIVFAKPYPLCYFNEKELHFLLTRVQFKNVCEISRNNNTNNLTVNPDGSFFPCMAMNSEEYRNEGLADLSTLESGYYASVEKLLRSALLPECRSCSLFYRGICQAACYAHL